MGPAAITTAIIARTTHLKTNSLTRNSENHVYICLCSEIEVFIRNSHPAEALHIWCRAQSYYLCKVSSKSSLSSSTLYGASEYRTQIDGRKQERTKQRKKERNKERNEGKNQKVAN